MSWLLVLAILLTGASIGAIVERWRWLRSDCAKAWTRETGESERLL